VNSRTAQPSNALTGRTILVVVAHPDDAEAFCGGTLAKLTRMGNRVILVICTNGDRGSHDTLLCPSKLVEIRREEQRHAQEMLGVKESIWLGYRDGQLSRAADLRDQLIRIIRETCPEIIITFDPWKHYEFHPDHRAVGFVTSEAHILADLPWICPEYTLEGVPPWRPAELYLFAPQDPNYWVDISDTIEIKIPSRLAHSSQCDFISSETERQRFVTYFRELAAEAGRTAGYAYAEAFRKVFDSPLTI
jgi:N,N'-diacetylchitobiose non-reducing end deacetylase